MLWGGRTPGKHIIVVIYHADLRHFAASIVNQLFQLTKKAVYSGLSFLVEVAAIHHVFQFLNLICHLFSYVHHPTSLH